MSDEHPLDIDDLIGLMPDEGVPWIRRGVLAWHEAAKSGYDLLCPYADASEESHYWHLGYIGAQALPDCHHYIERMTANDHGSHAP